MENEEKKSKLNITPESIKKGVKYVFTIAGAAVGLFGGYAISGDEKMALGGCVAGAVLAGEIGQGLAEFMHNLILKENVREI